MKNKILNTDIINGALQLEDESIDCMITSPPYWAVRIYQDKGEKPIEPSIWDGDPNCDHEFEDVIEKEEGYTSSKRWIHGYSRESNPKGWNTNLKKYSYCIKCNAWKGMLGLEPDFNLFIKHLCDIFDYLKPKLKKSGTLWINLDDTFGGSGNASGHTPDTKNLSRPTSSYGASEGNQKFTRGYEKCLLLLPERFAIEMVNRGWTLRNKIIWHKPNPTPESAKDRCTHDFEAVYFFVKSKNTLFWVNEKTLAFTYKQPPGTSGIEHEDWEWRICPKCFGTGKAKSNLDQKTKIAKKAAEYFGSPRARAHREPNTEDGTCKKCKGLGKIKYNFWSGYTYFYNQNAIREPISESKSNLDRRKYPPATNANFKNDGKQSKPTKAFSKEHRKTRNKRSVWTIPTKPNPLAHFATFPNDLVIPMIKAGCPEWVCSKCGAPRVPIYTNSKEYENLKEKWKHVNMGGTLEKGRNRKTGYPGHISKEIILIGASQCECNAEFIPGIVLDPFAGTGTTLLEAWNLGRDYIGIEISEKYCKIMEKVLAPTKNVRLDKFMTVRD